MDRNYLRFALVAATGLCAVPAAAQDSQQIENPPELGEEVIAAAPMVEMTTTGASTNKILKSAAGFAVPPAARETKRTLEIGYTETEIRDPGHQRFDRVRLRSYRQPGPVQPSAPFVAPTLRVNPGETVRITLLNRLPKEPDCDKVPTVNTPHCFNTTNLHSHGLWVSPTGNSDNVLIKIRPTVDFQYEYNIPPDHPAGTFWYHPHNHGSTALQVASGMAGALIVRGNRLPSAADTGDIDVLLRASGTAFRERILLFQQIQYACRDADGKIKTDAKGWYCDPASPSQPADVGTLESYDVLGRSSWATSGRYTTINGRTGEALRTHATVGKVERWRLIHGGIRDTIKLVIAKRVQPPAAALGVALKSFATLAADEQETWIQANCDTNALTHWQIAADGLTRDAASPRGETLLQPGYRADLLVLFAEPGDYCVLDGQTPADASVNAQDVGRRLLTIVTADTASGGKAIADPAGYLHDTLVASAKALPVDKAMRDRIVADLDAGLKLSQFVPHEDLRAATPEGTQKMVFSLSARTATSPDGLPTGPGLGTSAATARRYNPDDYARTLVLGRTEDWELSSAQAVGHPFHIHVNPFQLVSATGAGGADLLQDPASEYFGMGGVYKDTLFVEPSAVLTVRTRYRRYIGDFVLHCHILDHEDQGMMENVRITLPDGLGGAEPLGHGLHDQH
jgi:FtsP/CotA-like multicopper oxidase with cupredoxin domain